ncbi:hypothetical protein H4R34_006150 [Dimargaris verticillata]|uniref:Uncharacterized protein n=1 Tax=Dimargaris verticillata TaxID=2761393 RepID=A0A9W8E5X7_9FUNG|nr:hypothetical protein H4R34_006150 [Dimargaris verticillata]
MDHGLQAQDSPKAPTPGAMGKDTADGPWRPASPSPGEGRATANGPDPVRLAKRTSSLIVPGPSMALDYAGQSLGATTEGQLSQSDHGSPRLPTSDLPPDQPAKIPPFSSIITSDLANARSPLSAGSLSTSAWEQPPRLPLPALPRSPSRAYTKDDSRSAVIVPSAQMPPVAAHRSRPTRAEMLHAAPGTGGILPPMVDGFGHALPGSVNLGTESSRFATNGALGNHPPSPFYASPSAPSSRSQSPAPPGSLLSTTATASSTPRGNMSLEVPLASRLSTSTAVSPTAAAPHSAAPTMGSTTATGVGSGATFANPSSWFTRRNSQTAAAPTTKHKESFTNKFWKPIQTKQR